MKPPRFSACKPSCCTVECLARLPDDNTIASTLWTDTSGQAIKTRMQGMQQESFRTSHNWRSPNSPPAQSSTSDWT